MKIKKALCFDDILLVPKYWAGGSRREVDLGTRIAGIPLSLPIISANMPSVSGLDMALAMNNAGGMSIFDRMSPIEDQVQKIKEFKKIRPNGVVGGSIGVGSSFLKDAKELVDAGVDLLCIDVAHGFQRDVEFAAAEILKTFENFPLVIGNFADEPWGWYDFSKRPNLGLKIGVGSGANCTTRIQTGCGLPTFQSLLNFQNQDVPGRFTYNFAGGLIADGGIKTPGDCVKSLAAGASVVMLGSLLAGTTEAPGATIRDDSSGRTFKVYRGNASAGSKVSSGLKSEFIEGVETLVSFKGPVDSVLKQIEDGIRSGFTYCGAANLPELWEKAEFAEISNSGHIESQPHGIFGRK